MSQSSVNYWFEQLRKHPGDALFVRSGSGVAPAEPADSLIPLAKDILLKPEAIVTNKNDDSIQDNGVLNIAGTPIERHLMMAPSMSKTLDEAPELSLDMPPMGSASGTQMPS